MSTAARRLIVGMLTTPVLAAVGVVALVVTASAATVGADTPYGGVNVADAACPVALFTPGSPAAGTDAAGSASSAVAGLSAAQAGNAAVIVRVAEARQLGTSGAVIGVMTALTESSLVDVDHGDGAGPDSRGLFQQRDSWGPAAVRMDPAGAAGLFFDRLVAVPGWQVLPPWVAAQQVQRSAYDDGSNYAAHFQQAQAMVAAMLDIGDEVGNASAGCGGSAASGPGGWGGFSNGQIPASALCPLATPGQLLRCDAAAAFDAMAGAYRRSTGNALCITDSYRPLSVQQQLYVEKPSLAAVPGTSNHGWGVAVDLCEPGRTPMGYTTSTYQWLTVHAAVFGWTHPAWADPGQGRQEPWHWEYSHSKISGAAS